MKTPTALLWIESGLRGPEHSLAVCLRFAERDFRERSLEGIEEDWPLTYQEIAPDYAYVEIVNRACAKTGIRMIPTRKALLTVPYDGRPACHYCGRCMSGCDAGAVFSTAVSMIPKAQGTGNFTLVVNKLAREILVDQEGSARPFRY